MKVHVAVEDANSATVLTSRSGNGLDKFGRTSATLGSCCRRRSLSIQDGVVNAVDVGVGNKKSEINAGLNNQTHNVDPQSGRQNTTICTNRHVRVNVIERELQPHGPTKHPPSHKRRPVEEYRRLARRNLHTSPPGFSDESWE